MNKKTASAEAGAACTNRGPSEPDHLLMKSISS